MSSACSCPSAFVAACETTSFLFAMNWLDVFCTFGLSHAELPTWAFLTFRRALPRAFPNDSCLSQHVQVRKEVPARRSGPKAKEVSWTRSQNQSTNTKKKQIKMSMINHMQNKLKRVWLPPQSACELACALQLAQFYEPVISPYAGNDASTQSQTFEKIFPSRFDRHTTIKPMEGTTWGPGFITFQSWDSNISLWPLARIRRPENATSMYVPKTIPLYQVTSFHWAFSEQTCTRCEDGLPWIMLIWRLMWEKRTTSDIMIYVIIICTEGSVFATRL